MTLPYSSIVSFIDKPFNTTIYFNVSFNVAAIGDTVLVTCKTVSNPTATCHLYHQGNQLNMASNSYVIQGFKSSDQGAYNCSCTNILGKDSGLNTLTVYGTLFVSYKKTRAHTPMFLLLVLSINKYSFLKIDKWEKIVFHGILVTGL